MSRLTLRLPESLHQTLAQQAKDEGVSLNQMIVYLLARVTAVHDLGQQRLSFQNLLEKYPAEDAEAALHEVLAARS